LANEKKIHGTQYMYYDKHYAPTLFHHDDDNKACRVIHIYQLFSPNQIAE